MSEQMVASMPQFGAVMTPAADATNTGPATRLTGAIIAAIFVGALLPLFTTPMFPFIDLYNHLARYFVLSHLDTDPVFQQNYAANWSLLPNIGLDVAGTALMRVLPPAYAAHVVVVVIFAMQFGGVMLFNRALTGRWSTLVALLLVPLLYSFILNWGFANFLFGLGMVFASAAYWLARRDRPWRALPVACALVVLTFLSHGLAFALYGLLVGALELGFYLRRPGRRLHELFVALVPVALQAVIPAILFLAAPTSHAADGVTNADDAIRRLAQSGELPHRLWDLFCYRLATIARVAEGPSLWFDAVTLVVTLGLIGVLVARGRVTIVRVARPALLMGVVLVAITPPAMFGVGYVFDRMPLFLALIFVGSLATRAGGDMLDRAIVGALGLLIALRLVLIAVGWQDYAADYRDFEPLAERIPSGSMVLDVIVGGTPRLSTAPRCAMYRPILVAARAVVGPLFADEAKQPLRLVGPLRAAVGLLPPGLALGSNPPDHDDKVIAAAARGFDYILVCNVDALTRPIPASMSVIARTDRLTLLKVRKQ